MSRSGGAYKRGLNRAIGDAALAEIRRQLTYKTDWTGTGLHVADRWYPSSKTCSNCQAVKTKLPLNVRVFVCDHCGYRGDRDHNAALNLAALAVSVEDGTSPASCGRDVKAARQKPTIRPATSGQTVSLREHHTPVVNVAGATRPLMPSTQKNTQRERQMVSPPPSPRPVVPVSRTTPNLPTCVGKNTT